MKEQEALNIQQSGVQQFIGITFFTIATNYTVFLKPNTHMTKSVMKFKPSTITIVNIKGLDSDEMLMTFPKSY